MLDLNSMRKKSILPQEEILKLLNPKQLEKRSVSFKLSKKGRDIIAAEAKKYGGNKTLALEILLLEVLEYRKKRQ